MYNVYYTDDQASTKNTILSTDQLLLFRKIDMALESDIKKQTVFIIYKLFFILYSINDLFSI